MAITINFSSYLLSPSGKVIHQRNVPRTTKVLHYGTTNYPFRGLKLQLHQRGFGFMMNFSRTSFEDANYLIRDFVDDGHFENAIKVYCEMLEWGDPVEQFRFFPFLIKAFGGLSDVNMGRNIHGHLLKLGLFNDMYIVNSVMSMYFRLGETEDALQLFEKMGKRDAVSWNIMISGFSKIGDYRGSLILLKRMIRDYGEYANRVACLSALSSIASIQSLIHGQEIHGFVIKGGLDGDEFLGSALIEMYMKCRNINYAEHVFRNCFIKGITENIVMHNVMISGYLFNGCLSQGLNIFINMLEMGLKPDHSTMVAVLVLCSHLSNLAIGKQIHGFILVNGLKNDVRVETAIIDMYFRCGDPETGFKIFYVSKNKNLVTWAMVITNSAHCGYTAEALNLFSKFMLEYGFADYSLVLSVLRLCSSLTFLSKGKELHGLAIKTRLDSDVFLGGALVDMYGKCADVESCEKAFCNVKLRDLVLWNSLISGYAQNDCAEKALQAFRDMQAEKIMPNNVTIACVLSACAHLSIAMLCREVYCYALRRGIDSNVLICNSFIATFAKCGDIKGAWILFNKMPDRNDVSWNSIILALGLHGLIDEMSAVYEEMNDAGVKPDHATFTALLSACSHVGRVDMGWKYFQSMAKDYKLEPLIEQYTCMVDLLGRAGHLKRAYDLIMAMPCVPDDRIWGSLLASCKIHGNQELAEFVANHIFKLDPMSIGYRVLLANLYEDLGMWNEVSRMRSQVKELTHKKQPGCSWIAVKNSVHVFVSGDCSHHASDEIYMTIDNLTMEMRRI